MSVISSKGLAKLRLDNINGCLAQFKLYVYIMKVPNYVCIYSYYTNRATDPPRANVKNHGRHSTITLIRIHVKLPPKVDLFYIS